MKKYGFIAILFCFLCFSMISCGMGKNQDEHYYENSYTLHKNGSVENVLVEDFDQEYYSRDALSLMITDSINSFVSEHPDASVSLISCDRVLEDKYIRVQMKYDSAETYAAFNDVFFYYGTVLEALEKGYLSGRLFYAVKDGNILQISKENVEHYQNLHICITEENMNLYTFGDILYVDSATEAKTKRMASVKDSSQNHIVIFK